MLLFLRAFLPFHAATAAYGVLMFLAALSDPELYDRRSFE